MKKQSSQSWFIRVNKVANKYGLPNSYMIMNEYPWNKEGWKDVVKRAIVHYQEDEWRQKLAQLTTLSMINPGTIKFGQPHPVWKTAMFSPRAVKMAVSKVRFLTDTMMTGEKLHKMYGRKPICICGFPIEDRFHILLDCPTYADLRDSCVSSIVAEIVDNYPPTRKEEVSDRTVMAHMMLDPSWFRSDIGSSTRGFPNILTENTANNLEVIGRKFCFQIYRRRFDVLSEEENGSDDETDCSDEYSLCDTSSSSSSESDSDWEIDE